jgi:hypothetical protein
MRKNILITALLVGLSFNLPVTAKSVALSELNDFSIDNVKPTDNGKAFDPNHWAYRTLKNVTDKYGVLIGKPGEKFDGTTPISRTEAAIILVNLMGKVEEQNMKLSEADRAKVEILQQELGDEIDRLSGRVEKVENSVTELKGSVSNLEESNKKTWKNAFGEDFRITGGLQATYTAIPKKGSSDYSPNFGLPYSEIIILGKLHNHLNYTAQIVPTRTFTDQANGLLRDAYVSTDIIPGNTVYIGQMAKPFGKEAQLSPMNIDFIDYSQASRKLLSNSTSTYVPYNHDVGAMISGDLGFVNYSLGTFNGTGQNAFDKNRRQSVVGQISIKPFYKTQKPGGLELGSSMLHSSALTSDLLQNYNENILGFNSSYTYKKFNVKSEYMVKDGFINPGQVARSWNIDTKYNLTNKIQLLARYDNFDPNIHPSLNDLSADINTSIEYVGGINYLFRDNLSFMVNFVSVNNKFGKDSQRVGFMTQALF